MSPTPKPFAYRLDIDGLRGIAVLSVVLFHGFPNFLPGGFIGVDIFFVISGYLITSIIWIELEKGSFSFLYFYDRRIRRLLPALLILLIACLVLSWFFLLDNELKRVGKHVQAGALFISNFVLWGEDNYFNNEVDAKPLLHLWSLAVEEQFYIIWPLFLFLLLKKSPIKPLLALIAIGLFSFCYAIYLRGIDPAGVFFSPLTRFWELIIGSCIALSSVNKLPLLAFKDAAIRKKIENFLSILGLSLIGVGFYLCARYVGTTTRGYPSYETLFPTFGTALLLISINGVVNKRILTSPTLIWVGLISYPLYLYHWTLLSFASIFFSKTPPIIYVALILVLAIFLSLITYIYVEKPIRFKKKEPVYVLIFILLCCGIAGYLLSNEYGFGWRDSKPIIHQQGDLDESEFIPYMASNFYPCQPISVWQNSTEYTVGSQLVRKCFQSKKDTPPEIAIIGDSHAEHFFIGMAEELKKSNIVYYSRNGIPTTDENLYADIFNHILNEPNIKTVIISFNISLRMARSPKKLDVLVIDLTKTADELIKRGKKVYLMDGIPDFFFHPKYCKYESPLLRKHQCNQDRKHFDNKYLEYAPLINNVLKSNPNIGLIETSKILCDDLVCTMSADGYLLYRDKQHLNIYGSKYIARKLFYNGLNR